MIERCRNPNNPAFKHYGGRGITVCEKWLSFEAFLADMGERPAGLSIDRIEVNGNYEPGNCRWATDREQMNNRRNSIRVEIDGVELPLTEACERFGLIYATVYSRIRSGLHPLAALGLAVAPDGRNH